MLVDVPSEKIEQLCSVLRKEWPLSMSVINFMKKCHSFRGTKEMAAVYSFLYSKNYEESGVLVAINRGGIRGPIISVYALDGYEATLRDELMHWNFEWTDIISFALILPKHIVVIEEILQSKGYAMLKYSVIKCFNMPIERALQLKIECPEDVELGPLSTHHMDEIYETWVMKDEFTIDELRNWYELDKKYAIGIFCRKNGTLLSRCLRSPAGWITALQTVECARRKGYAILLLKEISRTMAKDSVEPWIYTADFNRTSLALFPKVGFEHAYDLESRLYERRSTRKITS